MSHGWKLQERLFSIARQSQTDVTMLDNQLRPVTGRLESRILKTGTTESVVQMGQLKSPRKGARNDWGSLGPWFDMMNHSAANYNVGYQFKPGYGLEITALRDINPEEELLITYGNNSDDDMFMFYGYVEPFIADAH